MDREGNRTIIGNGMLEVCEIWHEKAVKFEGVKNFEFSRFSLAKV